MILYIYNYKQSVFKSSLNYFESCIFFKGFKI